MWSCVAHSEFAASSAISLGVIASPLWGRSFLHPQLHDAAVVLTVVGNPTTESHQSHLFGGIRDDRTIHIAFGFLPHLDRPSSGPAALRLDLGHPTAPWRP